MGWKADPIAGLALACSVAIYSTGVIRAWRTAGVGRAIRAWEAALFALGWVVLAFAVISPLATWSEVMFSLHMTQHELLMVVVAPLIVSARPLTAVAWAIRSARHQIAESKDSALRQTGLSSVLLRRASGAFTRISTPIVAFTLQAMVLWTWHLPALYQRAIGNNWIHGFEHTTLLVTACLFWAGLTQGRYGRLGYGVAFLYVFATAMHSGALGALFTMAPSPLYPLYAARARALGLDALADQQLAGILMWMPACALLTVLALGLFTAWLGELERRNRQHRLSAFSPDP